ncbi:hypothetical protein [Serratia plymuthica]|uniref:hypothetical protein n=1 Tax=Serratia TaxID=613 RepID=UPI0011A2A636|nr:hypothetical protein [Serratia plymuthica]MBI6138810.1 hypothetical protein [Serratia plymuthica]UJE00101.1 hypothetical protein FS592_16580 [Serratia plymuthica]
MSVSDDIYKVALLCTNSAQNVLFAQLNLGVRPYDENESLLWEQKFTRLQGQLNSLTALNIKLISASISAALSSYTEELKKIGNIAEDAEIKINSIKDVATLLTKVSAVLDLGLAILAAAAAPSPATIGLVLSAGETVAGL